MRQLTVLVVNNSAWIRSMVKRTLESRFGAVAVKEASDGRAALAILESERIDIMVTAVELEHLSGLQLLDAVRGHPKLKSLPVLIMVSHNNEVVKLKAMRYPGVHCIDVPFKPDALEAEIRAMSLEAIRRSSGRYAGLPPHTLVMNMNGAVYAGTVFDIGAGGVAGKFPASMPLTMYTSCVLNLTFTDVKEYPPVGPIVGTLIRVEGGMDEATSAAPSAVMAFVFGKTAMSPDTRAQFDTMLLTLAARTPDEIAEG